MHPILFKIGSVPIQTVGLLHGLAFLTGFWWLYREARRYGISAQKINDLAGVIIVAAVVGARLFSILFDGSLGWYLKHPVQIFAIWHGGFTFYGGFLFGVGAGLWYLRKHHLDGWRMADFIAPGLALAGVVGRLGCLASGDSFGKPSQLPWAITFTDPQSLAPLNVPLHPTQIYSAITNLLIFVFLVVWRKRQSFQGEIFLIYLLVYAITRFMIEIFRNDPRGVYLGGMISTSQFIGILILAVALPLIYIRRKTATTGGAMMVKTKT